MSDDPLTECRQDEFRAEHGRGVVQDEVTACMWYSIAADQGFEQAQSQRQVIARLMSSEDIAYAEQMAAEWQPTPSAMRASVTVETPDMR